MYRMESYDRTLREERTRLRLTIDIAENQLAEAQSGGKKSGAALTSAKNELYVETQQMFTDLQSTDDFISLLNLNQYAQSLSIRQTMYDQEQAHIQSLMGILKKPYFARIDLRFDDEEETDSVYIGRAMLRERKTGRIDIHDWRSPIAGVFYRYGAGPARYTAPAGVIECELVLKRHFEIEDGHLSYFFDADVQVEDEFLRNLLAKNAAPQMRAIVETIQREQDTAIRDSEHDLVMVQGAAGSGKTSIALHRVAYLMYEGLSSKLQAGDVVILSLNSLFERYIAGVLPELGEANVQSLTVERLLTHLLNGAPVQSRTDRFEAQCAMSPEARSAAREDERFKSSSAFARMLDRMVSELPRRWIDFTDVYYAGELIASRSQLRQRLLKLNGTLPLGDRLAQMERSLWDGIHQRRPARLQRLADSARGVPGRGLEAEAIARAHSIEECAALRRQIFQFTHPDCRALYAALFADAQSFCRLAAEESVALPDDFQGILDRTRTSLAGDLLSHEDAVAIAYLSVRLYGHAGERYSKIRQVVVDEAQDYSPMHYELIRSLFPKARFTVLGDVDQSIEQHTATDVYEAIERALLPRKSTLLTLKKSYRSTWEIFTFCRKLLGGSAPVESFHRRGDAPNLVGAHTSEELEKAVALEAERCVTLGYHSVALIAKTAEEARAWHARLSQRLNATLVDGDSGELRGVFILPVMLTKGLEFDAILVLDADDIHYSAPDDRNILYVACTRALHRLSLFWRSAPSPFIDQEV